MTLIIVPSTCELKWGHILFFEMSRRNTEPGLSCLNWQNLVEKVTTKKMELNATMAEI
jgi:hypothetical protein